MQRRLHRRTQIRWWRGRRLCKSHPSRGIGLRGAVDTRGSSMAKAKSFRLAQRALNAQAIGRPNGFTDCVRAGDREYLGRKPLIRKLCPHARRPDQGSSGPFTPYLESKALGAKLTRNAKPRKCCRLPVDVSAWDDGRILHLAILHLRWPARERNYR